MFKTTTQINVEMLSCLRQWMLGATPDVMPCVSATRFVNRFSAAEVPISGLLVPASHWWFHSKQQAYTNNDDQLLGDGVATAMYL